MPSATKFIRPGDGSKIHGTWVGWEIHLCDCEICLTAKAKAKERKTHHRSDPIWPKTPTTSLPRDWARDAACQDADHLSWVPPINGQKKPREQHYWMAETYCASCPVRRNCLRFAKETKSEGIWGGWYLGTYDSQNVNLLKRSDG